LTGITRRKFVIAISTINLAKKRSIECLVYKSDSFLIFFSIKTKGERMSTMKFGMKKKTPQESSTSGSVKSTSDSSSSGSSGSVSSSQSVPSPSVPSKVSVPVSVPPKTKVSFADLYRKGAKVTTENPITAEKSDQIPPSAIRRNVKSKDEAKLCPKEFTDLDVAEKLRETEELANNVPEYEIIGAEISVFDVEKLALNNEAPLINSGDSTGDGSLGDPRMGVIENDAFCQTCGGNNIQCTGHFGYIKLSAPIYNPLFAPLIPKVLSCVCITCGGTFLNEETIREKGVLRYDMEKRLNFMAEESASQMCQRCQSGEMEVDEEEEEEKEEEKEEAEEKKKGKGKGKGKGKEKKKTKRKVKGGPGSHFSFIWNKDCMQIQAEVSGECEGNVINGVHFLSTASSNPSGTSKKSRGCTVPIEDVYSILSMIEPQALEWMGFEHGHHPKNFIMNYFPVLPPVSRQPKFVEGKLIEDKLTEQYRTIISRNRALAVARKENKDNDVRALFDEIDKFVQGTEASKKGVFKSIKEKLQGKEERIRGTIMGRRVNFSARTVLGPKPSLRFGQIGVPRVWAKILRQQVLVCNVNRDKLQKYLIEGRIRFIFPSDTKYKGLPIFVNENIRKKYLLQIGDNVERDSENGDYVIFNRQPTLHKQSMMGYQAVFHDQFTIGMHISTTRPHNADKVSHRQQQEATL
jgi:DNA-directed RNA polymerase beta' subunit